jgi:hypothetical protein
MVIAAVPNGLRVRHSPGPVMADGHPGGAERLARQAFHPASYVDR